MALAGIRRRCESCLCPCAKRFPFLVREKEASCWLGYLVLYLQSDFQDHEH
jgi:hypothetical protein